MFSFECSGVEIIKFISVHNTETYEHGLIKKNKYVQSNLGSRTPRIMNNSVYEQIFR